MPKVRSVVRAPAVWDGYAYRTRRVEIAIDEARCQRRMCSSTAAVGQQSTFNPLFF